MRQKVSRAKQIEGIFTVPGDKSISHRALILNAVGDGSAFISGMSVGADVMATVTCLESLGVKIETTSDPHMIRIHGRGSGLSESHSTLNAFNSGTTIRLLTGVLAAQPFRSVLTGDNSLRSRPMGRVIKPLKDMGACIVGRNNNTLAPIVIMGGALQGTTHVLPVASAQVKSAIILAGLRASGDTIIEQPAVSRDHTERMVKAMGGIIKTVGLALHITPGPLKCLDVNIPGDISAAAFWIIAALCHPSALVTIRNVGINPGRTGILEVLREMGAEIRVEEHDHQGGEPNADLIIRSSSLEGVEVGGDIIPRLLDEIPILAVAACFARGTTVIRDAKELRVKESDRVKTTVAELSRLGAAIEERPDGMVIHGVGRLKGQNVSSHGDHRLAMALAVAGLLADGDTIVDGAEAASVSYPQFWEDLNYLSKG